MAQINAGRVRFVSRGEYDNSTQYYIFDLITYNGNSYYAKKNTLGTLPTNTEYWQLIAEKGNTGNTGPQGETGNGIASIAKTSSSGLVDTYTMTYTNGDSDTFEVTNGQDGEVTQEQLNEVQEELDRYKTIENALPHITGEGETITLDNTANSVLHLDLKGNTYQTSTSISGGDEYDSPTPDHPQDIHIVSGDNTILVSNKNKLAYPSFSSLNVGGVTFTNNKGTYTIGGTTGTNNNFGNHEVENYIIQEGDYIQYNNDFLDTHIGFSLLFSDGTNSYNSFSSANKIASLSNHVGKKLTHIRFNFNTGYAFSGTCSPMIVKNSSQVQFITHQSQMQLISLPVENLLNLLQRENKSNNGVTTSNEFENSVELTGTSAWGNASYLYKLTKNTNYTLSFDEEDTISHTAGVSIYGNDTNDFETMTSIIGNTQSIVANTPIHITTKFNSGNHEYICIRFWNNSTSTSLTQTTNLKISNIQLEKGDKANSYSPYGTTPIEYCEIGDYKDKFFKNTVDSEDYVSTLELDKWYLKKNIGKVVLDGSETWTKESVSGGNNYYTKINDAKGGNANVIYNNLGSYRNSVTGEVNAVCFISSSNNLNFRYDDVTTINDFKTLLNTTNMVVVYQLATPEYILLNDTLQEQLDNLQRLLSYDEQTNISQENNDLPFKMIASAIRKLNNE